MFNFYQSLDIPAHIRRYLTFYRRSHIIKLRETRVLFFRGSFFQGPFFRIFFPETFFPGILFPGGLFSKGRFLRGFFSGTFFPGIFFTGLVSGFVFHRCLFELGNVQVKNVQFSDDLMTFVPLCMHHRCR